MLTFVLFEEAKWCECSLFDLLSAWGCTCFCRQHPLLRHARAQLRPELSSSAESSRLSESQ